MRSTACLLALGLATLCAACTSPVRVSFDERVDFTRYRTWDWLPGLARSAEGADADAYVLGRKLMRHVEEVLADKGLARDRLGAELLVGARLRVERRLVEVARTGAVQQLSSLHDSPSFVVQSTEVELLPYETGSLAIHVASARDGRTLWRGTLERDVRGEIAPRVGELVAELLARFPPPPPDAAPPPRREPRRGRSVAGAPWSVAGHPGP